MYLSLSAIKSLGAPEHKHSWILSPIEIKLKHQQQISPLQNILFRNAGCLYINNILYLYQVCDSKIFAQNSQSSYIAQNSEMCNKRHNNLGAEMRHAFHKICKNYKMICAMFYPNHKFVYHKINIFLSYTYLIRKRKCFSFFCEKEKWTIGKFLYWCYIIALYSKKWVIYMVNI